MTQHTMIVKIRYGVFMTSMTVLKAITGQTKRLIYEDYWGFFASEK